MIGALGRIPPKLRLVPQTQPASGTPSVPAERPSSERRVQDDRDLLAALRAGDVGAARPFHDRVRSVVDRTTFRLLGPRDLDREDVAQSAMIELITTIDRYRGECSLDSWAAIVSARVVFKHLRRERLERRIFEVSMDPEANAAPSLQPVVGRSVLSRVVELLREMDSGRAWAFVLHDVHGYDLRETAQIVGASVAAAQARLVRARKELHAKVAADLELGEALRGWEGAR